jgi:hypothetical protein
MPTINGDEYFLFTEADTFGRLLKSIYGGKHIKVTAFKNPVLSKMDILKPPPPKKTFAEAASINSGSIPSPNKSPHLSSPFLIYKKHLGLQSREPSLASPSPLPFLMKNKYRE